MLLSKPPGLRCPAFASGVAAPSQKTDRCPCSASAVSAAGSASAAQPATLLMCPPACGRAPRGGSKRETAPSAVHTAKGAVFLVCLTTQFASVHGRKLGSPSGGTNSDRCQWQKQGAVSGAALRFLQALTRARRKNRLSARGAGETPARAARLRGEPRSKTERANFLRHILTLAKTGPLVYNKTGEIYPDGQPRRASARPARRGAWAENRAVRSVLCGMFFILSYLSRIIRPYRIVQRAGEGRAVPGPCPRL